MGIVSSTLDPFNLNNDYGVQSTNRPHIFNAAYSYNFGELVHNKLAGGFVNGWQVSGIVQVQSGANLTGQRTAELRHDAQQRARSRAPPTTSAPPRCWERPTSR